MDYEYRIQLLDKETAYLRDMLQIARERQDTADERLDKLQAITRDTVEAVNQLALTTNMLAVKVDTLAGKVDTLVVKMDALVEAMLRQHPNGH